MLAEQTQETADLTRLTLPLGLRVRTRVQSLANVAVAKAVEGELSTQKNLRQLSIWPGKWIQTAVATPLTQHRTTDGVGNFPQRRPCIRLEQKRRGTGTLDQNIDLSHPRT